MVALDCTSEQTTYESLEKILGVGQAELRAFLTSLPDVEQLFDNAGDIDPDNYVHHLWVTAKNLKPLGYQQGETYFFHLTRTFDLSGATFFSQGIKSLAEQIDFIWSQLFELASKTNNFTLAEWNNFRRNMGTSHWAELYTMKTQKKHLGGPYGILIRDLAFTPSS
jgi:hypothetical protein